MKETNFIVTKWRELDIKSKLAIVTALIAFTLGWCITIWGFVVPPLGDVADSNLWILGQSLLYASGVFGITSYVSASNKDMRLYMDRRLREEERFRHYHEEEEEDIDGNLQHE